MLSAIVQKATGQTVLDYLRPRLFEPLGIDGPDLGHEPAGDHARRLRAEHPHRGHRAVRPALPAEGQVARQAARARGRGSRGAPPARPPTAAAPTSDWDQGYGYQFWRCRHGAYRGDGAFGQFCVVLPEQDAVVAITSGTRDLQGSSNLVWEHLLPALDAKPLPADKASATKLRQKLASLTLPPQAGEATRPLAPQVSGKRYAFPANDAKLEALAVEFGADGVVIVARQDGREQPCARRPGIVEEGRQPAHHRRRREDRRERRLDRGRHLHGEARGLRDPVRPDGRAAVEGRRAARRHRVQRGLRRAQAARGSSASWSRSS